RRGGASSRDARAAGGPVWIRARLAAGDSATDESFPACAIDVSGRDFFAGESLEGLMMAAYDERSVAFTWDRLCPPVQPGGEGPGSQPEKKPPTDQVPAVEPARPGDLGQQPQDPKPQPPEAGGAPN